MLAEGVVLVHGGSSYVVSHNVSCGGSSPVCGRRCEDRKTTEDHMVESIDHLRACVVCVRKTTDEDMMESIDHLRACVVCVRKTTDEDMME